MPRNEIIIAIVMRHYPTVQGIYLFGSYSAGNAWPQSDLDIALLLPHKQAKSAGSLALSVCRFDLETALVCGVDLLNARQVSTVFQKEIIAGELIFCQDQYATEEFEMLTLSFYQKLNQERAEILASFYETGRAYVV